MQKLLRDILTIGTLNTVLAITCLGLRAERVTDTINKKSPFHVPGNANQQRRQEDFKDYLVHRGENIDKKIRSNLFLKAEATKQRCYIGEPVVVTFKLYSRLPATSVINKQPTLEGFSVYEMNDFIAMSGSVETFNNKAYDVHTVKKCQLIPLQAGALLIDPLSLSNTVHLVKATNSDSTAATNLHDLFNQMISEESASATDQQVSVSSNPLSIQVSALPETSRPVDFNGAVGHSTIQATVADEEIQANDFTVLKVTIQGHGNIPLIEAPSINWPTGIEVLDTISSEIVDKSVAPLAGSRKFAFRFSPGEAGELLLRPVTFSYFDPVSSSYKTIHSQSNRIRVTPSTKSTIVKREEPLTSSTAAQDTFPGIALNFVKGQYAWIAGAGIMALLCFLYIRKGMLAKRKTDVPEVKTIPDKTVGIENFQTDIIGICADKLAAGDFQSFYKNLGDGMWTLLSAKLGLSPTDLNKSAVRQALHEKNWTSEHINKLDEILVSCERSRYLPDYTEEIDKAELLKEAKSTIDKLTAL